MCPCIFVRDPLLKTALDVFALAYKYNVNMQLIGLNQPPVAGVNPWSPGKKQPCEDV